MSNDLFERWFDALPTYKQVRSILHKDDRYCCLGVLEELHYGPEVWAEDRLGFSKEACSSSYPSPEACEAAGFDVVMVIAIPVLRGHVEYHGVENHVMALAEFLAAYNDAGYSFDFIRRIAATYRRQSDA